jgi:hypothetical protein
VVELDPATQQLISAASQHLSGDELTSFLAITDAQRLANPDGTIDADKISGHFRTLFGLDEQPQQQRRDWGQSSTAGGPPKQPGDNARAALRKRHGVGADTNQPGDSGRVSRGENARAALQRRHGVKGQK